MSKNIIKLNRGDSYSFSIVIPTVGKPEKNYILDNQEDVVYFALLCPNQPFENALFYKGYTASDQDSKTGEILIQISPNDTRLLPSGAYYYTVKLQRGGTHEIIDDLDDATEVRTIIERTKFILNE